MNATSRLAMLLTAVVFVSPDTLHAATPHDGRVVRDGFELSDLALFVIAALGVFLARRSLRRRGPRAKD